MHRHFKAVKTGCALQAWQLESYDLKHNKRPGWQVLARGFEDLLIMEQGASAVIETTCVQ